jgi:hypothetical protein
MLLFGVLQFPRRNRTISSQSSLLHEGQKTAIVQPSKNSDEFFSKSISNPQVRYGLQHLCDERDHVIMAGFVRRIGKLMVWMGADGEVIVVEKMEIEFMERVIFFFVP